MSFGNKMKMPKAPKPPKAPKAAGRNPFSSRTVIGVICIVLALGITFGVSPLINRFTDRKTDIVRLKSNVPRGQVITVTDIEIAKVGAYNLPSGVITDGKSVIGKYAATDLYAGDYLFPEKLSDDNKSANDVLLGLDGKKVAVSVSIGSFAQGLSGKLENGDIVSAIIYDKDRYSSYVPAELKYIKVITTTTNEGVDKDQKDAGSKAATVTLLVTPGQAELLAQYNSVTSLHFALVYRGDKDKADAFIKAQDDYLAAHPITQPDAQEENDG